MIDIINAKKPDSKPPRRRDKVRTVTALKRAARDLLVSEGIAGLSIQPILNKAGVSRGALFHHFPTKNHLIAAAFSDLLEDAGNTLNDLGYELRSGRITLEQFVEGIRGTFCSDLFVGSMEIALSNRVEPALRALIEDAVSAWWRTLAGLWTDTFDLPGLSRVDAEQHWVMASNLLRGHAFTSTFRSSPSASEAFCRAFIRLMLTKAVVRESDQ